jgi:hypothetical protein
MHAGRVRGRRGASALVLVLAALLAALWTGIAPASAQPAGAAAAEVQPTGPTAFAAGGSGDARALAGRVIITPYPPGAGGAQAARDHVHTRSRCGDAFCTIQSDGTRYLVFAFSGCDRFYLENFRGLYDSHNHGSLSVYFYGADGQFLANYWGGRSDRVLWDPVYSLQTCVRPAS